MIIAAVLQGIFTEINSDEDAARESAVKFLTTKVKQIPAENMTKGVEEYLVSETKKVCGNMFLFHITFMYTSTFLVKKFSSYCLFMMLDSESALFLH